MLVFSFPSWPRGPSDSTPESSNRLRRRIIRFSFWTPVQIKAWNPLKDTPTTQPRSSQNREGRFANTAFLVGEWNRNSFFVIILFWLILFVSRFSRFWIFPLRHLFGSYLYPTPRLTEPDIFPALASYPTPRLTKPSIFPALTSCPPLRLTEPGVFPALASCPTPRHCSFVVMLHRFVVASLRCFNVAPLHRFVVTPFFVHVFYCFSVLSLWAFGPLDLRAFELLSLWAFELLSLWAFGPPDSIRSRHK